MNNQPSDVLWSEDGYSQFFGAKIPFCRYEIRTDCIVATEGFFAQRTQTIPLYRIAAKEVRRNLLGRLCKCGIVKLITRGQEVPDLELHVKHPEKVCGYIEEAIQEESNRYQVARRKNCVTRNTK